MRYEAICPDVFEGKRQNMVEYILSGPPGFTGNEDLYVSMTNLLADLSWCYVAWAKYMSSKDETLRGRIESTFTDVQKGFIDTVDMQLDAGKFASPTHFFYINTTVTSMVLYFTEGWSGKKPDWSHPYGLLSFLEAALAIGKQMLTDFTTITKRDFTHCIESLYIYLPAVHAAAEIDSKAVIEMVNKFLAETSNDDLTVETFTDAISIRDFRKCLYSFCRIDKIISSAITDSVIENMAELLERSGLSLPNELVMNQENDDDDFQERLNRDAGDFLDDE